jgi:hypothetical protein
MAERQHAESCMYNRGADCDCGYDDTAWQHELIEEHRFPPHTCVIGPEGPCQACWMLEEERAASEPSDDQVLSWAIHDDHRDPHEEYGYDYPFEEQP